jgi:hypothetical protein
MNWQEVIVDLGFIAAFVLLILMCVTAMGLFTLWILSFG